MPDENLKGIGTYNFRYAFVRIAELLRQSRLRESGFFSFLRDPGRQDLSQIAFFVFRLHHANLLSKAVFQGCAEKRKYVDFWHEIHLTAAFPRPILSPVEKIHRKFAHSTASRAVPYRVSRMRRKILARVDDVRRLFSKR